MQDAYIYDGLRTPIGRHAGVLAPIRPDDLLAGVIAALIQRNPFALADYEDAVIGCTNQAGEDSRNIARHAALLSGLPMETGGLTVNRLCGSGLAAVLDVARAASCNQGQLFVAGGVESMSRAPFVLAKSEQAYSRTAKIFDSTMGARFPNPKITKSFGEDTMPQTGDNVARDQGITREQADRFALASQEKYAKAKADSFYTGELLPVTVPGAKKDVETIIDQDEHPRPNTTMERLAELNPVYPDGVVTAGNASGINDGAAALLLGTKSIGDKAGKAPMARIVSAAIAGVPPRVMGIGPVPASQKALARAGETLKDMDVIEINEAFASQVLGCLKLLGIPFDDSRINPNGGAIAIGHPLGASGARLALTAIRQLQRSKGRYALVSMCIGVGQGIACVIENTARA
jgi:acetyl-CoA C-acetyltransferase